MDFNMKDVASSVNVTVHKNYLKTDGNASYAKVKRNKADLGAVVSEALKNSTTLKADGIMSAALLLKQAVLTLLQQGHAVDVLNVGTFYLTACGNIEGDNPSISDIPEISIAFSPSDEAKAAVKDVVVDSASSEESEPVINKVQDRFTFKTDGTVTAGKTMMVFGRKLRIAGEESKVGVFFAPEKDDGSYDTSGADWLQVKESRIGTNLPKTLDFNLPEGLKAGSKYKLIIKTSSGMGKRINKLVRTTVYEKTITVV